MTPNFDFDGSSTEGATGLIQGQGLRNLLILAGKAPPVVSVEWDGATRIVMHPDGRRVASGPYGPSLVTGGGG